MFSKNKEETKQPAQAALMAVALVLAGCARSVESVSAYPSVPAAKTQTSISCRECHVEIFNAWAPTDHALANRPVDASRDAAAFETFPRDAKSGSAPTAEMILGHAPLWQPLIPASGGRWQAHELAYDPKAHEWFNVFGAEHRQAGEWGHWTGRGMNWNSRCAQCHLTGYQKNYDGKLDRYNSTWVEHGVGCIQCHGPTKPGHGAKNAIKEKSPAPFHGDRQKMMETCATCHARAEQLTLDFQPGDRYADHFRVELPTDPAVFYPDGQQRDEDFSWTSVLLSRMGHAGVTCLDCHDPHTTKVVLPVANNQLCMQCHAAPGRQMPNGTRAVPIEPVAHSHHAEKSEGNQCVTCHMPTTTYMQRAPRHDHGWLKPDPLLTQELGIPNACSRCHADKSIEWTIAKADEWYGAKLDSRQRARARAVAAAQRAAPGADGALLALLAKEDIPAWRATYLSLLSTYGTESPTVVAAARAALTKPDPLERAVGVRALTEVPEAREWLKPLLKDPVRLVRLDAEWALSSGLPSDSPERKEFNDFLGVSLDQPAGRLRLGQDLANRGELAEAEKQIALASRWDPNSATIRRVHAVVLSQMGRHLDAARELQRVADDVTMDAQAAMEAGLAYAAAERPAEAETAFRAALKRDPTLSRAWYNLGLFLAQAERLDEATGALEKAESLDSRRVEYPYALAAVLLRRGDRDAARMALQRALQIDPKNSDVLNFVKILDGP